MIISSTQTLAHTIESIVTDLFGWQGQPLDYPTVRLRRSDGPIRANGMVFTADLDLSYYGYADDGNTRLHKEQRRSRTVHFLYYGHTAVWSATTGSEPGDHRCRWSELKLDEWKFETAHDSCWRGRAGDVLFKHWIELREQVIAHVPESERKAALHRVHDTSRLGGTFAKPFSAVDVELRREPGTHDYHQYAPSKITEVKLVPAWAVPVR